MNLSEVDGEPCIRIAMVGPSGVGKTSLLAAMFNTLQDEICSLDCQLLADSPTTNALQSRLTELKGLAEGGIKIQKNQGVGGTATATEYNFDLVFDSDSQLRIQFIDLPGGWYTGGEGYKKADEILAKSQVTLLAVDSVALMQNNSLFHEIANAPLQIKTAFGRALHSFDPHHALIIVLMRAESYRNQLKELYSRTREAYKTFLPILKVNYRGERIQLPVYLTHVETVGCVTVNSVKIIDDTRIEAKFIRNEGGYSPKFCERPLRLVLREAFQRKHKEVIDGRTFWDILLELFPGLSKNKSQRDRINQILRSLSEKLSEDDFVQIQ